MEYYFLYTIEFYNYLASKFSKNYLFPIRLIQNAIFHHIQLDTYHLQKNQILPSNLFAGNDNY